MEAFSKNIMESYMCSKFIEGFSPELKFSVEFFLL